MSWLIQPKFMRQPKVLAVKAALRERISVEIWAAC